MVRVNGELLSVDVEGRTLADFLAGSSFSMARIAVEHNGEIVPKAAYNSTVLKDGDSLEIVNFVGGG